MMSDHIFERNTIQQLVEAETLLDSADIILASDSMFQQKEGIDLGDATKIQVEEGYITDIGKEIETYNAIDTGLFLSGPRIFEELEKLFRARGDVSLTEGNRLMAEKKRFLALDIGKNEWQDVDTLEDMKIAEKKLMTLYRQNRENFMGRFFRKCRSLFSAGKKF